MTRMLAAGLAALLCGAGSALAAETSAAATATAAATEHAGTAAAAETPLACPVSPATVCDPSLFEEAPDIYRVEFQTGVGAFTLEVQRENAPRSADRLYNLVKLGYYNDMRFFRVNGKVVQFGVNALKDMNRKIYPEQCDGVPGGCFVSDPVKVSNLAGTVSFAANTREDLCTNINPSADVCSSPDQGDLILTNEIFINTIDNPQYDGVGFAPVGSVVEGMDVVAKIYGGYGEFNDPAICEKNLPGVPCAGPDYKLYQDGNEYFDPNFPEMTHLERSLIVFKEDNPTARPTETGPLYPWAPPHGDEAGATGTETAAAATETATHEPTTEVKCPAEPASVCTPNAWDPAPEIYRVQFETDAGAFTLEVTRSLAPRSADRLYNLVTRKYFDDMRFFRVNGKVVQFGVNALKDMNRVIYPEQCDGVPGGCFVSDPVKTSNLAGTVSFAANTREDLCTNINPSADVCSSPDQGDLILTNEIFINTIDNPQYDGVGFAPVGSVVEGMDVVAKIYGGYGEFNDPAICEKNLPGVPCAGPDYKLYQDGNEYFDPNFPEMTKLIRSTVVYKEDAKPGETTDPAAAAPAPTDSGVASEAEAAAAPEEPTSSSGGGMSGGAIAGLVIGLIVVIGAGVGGGVWFLRNRRRRRFDEYGESTADIQTAMY